MTPAVHLGGIFYGHVAWDSVLKGSVQRKLRWVKNGVIRRV